MYRYSREHIIEGSVYAGKDRHNGEIAAFHLSRILGLNRAPIVTGRTINLRTEILPVATFNLKRTFLYEGIIYFIYKYNYIHHMSSIVFMYYMFLYFFIILYYNVLFNSHHTIWNLVMWPNNVHIITFYRFNSVLNKSIITHITCFFHSLQFVNLGTINET